MILWDTGTAAQETLEEHSEDFYNQQIKDSGLWHESDKTSRDNLTILLQMQGKKNANDS